MASTVEQLPHTGYPNKPCCHRWTVGQRRQGRTLPVENPATGRQIATLAYAGKADLDKALAAAERGFQVWRKVSAFEAPS